MTISAEDDKTVITGDEIISSYIERDLLMGEYLGYGECMMLYAKTGQGKTINALIAGVAVATGGQFYGWQVREPVPVLFVEGGELTADGISMRLQRIFRRNGISSCPNFHLKAPTKERPFKYDITDEAHQEVLKLHCEKYGTKLVILDNYNSLRNLSENEFWAWMRVEKLLDWFRLNGIASIIVHHTNKGGEQQSGVQRKEDYCDIVVRVGKSPCSTKTKKYVEFSMEKNRWGECAPMHMSELSFDADGNMALIKVDYERVLKDSISRDLKAYGAPYLKQKYKFLGYRIFEYLDDIEREAVEAEISAFMNGHFSDPDIM